jgi:hypothetical protein
MTYASQELSLGQFVKQLAALLQQKEVQLPFKNQKPWHVLFYELKKQSAAPGRPKFFDELTFDWDAPYPKCQQLSEFLNALHFTASVSARNPHFDVITLSPEVAERWAQSTDQDDPELKGFVHSAVVLAENEFAAQSTE